MYKTFVTFGQRHSKIIDNKLFDKDCVAVIKSFDEQSGRDLAFEYFGDQFFTTYFEDQFDMNNMIYFPRGFIEIGSSSITNNIKIKLYDGRNKGIKKFESNLCINDNFEYFLNSYGDTKEECLSNLKENVEAFINDLKKLDYSKVINVDFFGESIE